MTSGKKRKKGPPVAAKPKRCFFCGAEGPLTQEHVLPDWLRHLGFKGTGVRELVQDSDVPIIQQGGAFSKTLKIVCADCNNVWMSAMEDDAKPVLLAMFQAAATGKQTMLDSSAQLALARWAFGSHLDYSVVSVKTTTSFGADRSMSGDGVSGLRQHRGEVLDDDVGHVYPWMKAAGSTRRMTISGRTRRGSIVHGSCNTPGVEQAEA